MWNEMMENYGREDRKDNDLFFTCSLIDYISRKTKNKRADVVNLLGEDRLRKIYDLADVYHSDNIDRVSDDFIEEAQIPHWDIGKVYKRLIKMVAKEQNIDRIKALQMVYNSFISEKIDDYNSSVYYENPSYIYECFAESRML